MKIDDTTFESSLNSLVRDYENGHLKTYPHSKRIVWSYVIAIVGVISIIGTFIGSRYIRTRYKK